MRLALVCFYCLCVFVYVLYFIATMSFAGYFLSVLFCLLSMLISDSRFDLVWFRLSCDHGWIRSGSVNVRKQQQQQTTTTTPVPAPARPRPLDRPRPRYRLPSHLRLQSRPRPRSLLPAPRIRLPPRYDALVPTPGLANGAIGCSQAPPPVCRNDDACGMRVPAVKQKQNRRRRRATSVPSARCWDSLEYVSDLCCTRLMASSLMRACTSEPTSPHVDIACMYVCMYVCIY